MKICIVTESFYPEIDGGAVHSRLLSERIKQAGHEVLVITRRPSIDYPKTEFVANCQVLRVGLDDRYGMLGRYLGIFTIMPSLIRSRNRYDTVLIAAPRILGAPVIFLMALLGKKCVVKPDSCGEMDGSYALDQTRPGSFKRLVARLYFSLRNIILKRAAAYIAISSVIVDEMTDMGIERQLIHHIPNGVDTERFISMSDEEKRAFRLQSALPTDRIIFSYCGRLTYEKGLQSLIRAWHRLVEKNQSAHLLLIGSGVGMSLDCEHELKAYVTNNGLEASVTFTGGMEDVSGFVACSDVFVLPSKTEALGIALIEAQLSGLAAIACRVGGIPDVVVDGVNGLLVSPDNDQELFDALTAMLENKNLRKVMGQKARLSSVAKFSISSITKKYIDLLQAVVNQKTADGNQDEITNRMRGKTK